jgi:membrane-bound ClpP family serine protease
MTGIAILFVIGAVFLGAEIFLPGGILGVFAAIALIGGCGLAFVDFGASGGLVAVVAASAMVGVVLFFEFSIVPKTAFGKRLFLNASVSGNSAVVREHDYVGSTGVTVTTLGPSGYITVEGKRHEAFSRSGFLDKDVAVKVVGSDNFRLIVTPEN